MITKQPFERMTRGLFIIILLCQFFTSAAQKNLPDSLSVFLSREPKDQSFVNDLNDIAFDYLKSDPALARKLALRASKIADELDFPKGYSRSLNVTGSSYWVVGDYESALRYYQLSAKESQSINDKVGLSGAFHNMGEVYKKVGNYRKAIEYLNYSLELDRQNQMRYAITLFNIGEAYLLLQKEDSALLYFDKAMEQAIPVNDKRTMAYVNQNKGKIKFADNEYDEALDYYEKSEELWRSQGDIRSQIQIYQDFAELYVTLHQSKKAEQYASEAMELADKIHASDLQIVNYEIESKILKLNGEFKKSLEILEKHNSLKDSVYDLKKSEQIAFLQASFESESREIENQKLKADQLVKDARIRNQELLIIGISVTTILIGIMAWVLYRQHRKILEVNHILRSKNEEIEQQKLEIESQAEKLKELNLELSELNKSLENRIEIRTNQLKNRNQKLAEYAYMNAHQLRAPIVSIIGLMNLIEKIDLPNDDRVMIEHLVKCSKKLDEITKDISKNLSEDSLFSENLED